MGVMPKSERTKAGPSTMRDALGLGHLRAAIASCPATDSGSLTSVGYQVPVVCPRGSGEPGYEVIDLAELSGYRPYAPGAPEIPAEAK